MSEIVERFTDSIDCKVPGGRLRELQDAEMAVERIRAICDEPLDERQGHGPTRIEQFARIDAIVHEGKRGKKR